MNRIVIFYVLLFFSVAAFAQGNTADKTSIAKSESSNLVEISFVAIPFDQMHNSDIDPDSYHKAVTIADSAGFHQHEVEVVTSAREFDDGILRSEKKEILKANNFVEQNKNSAKVQNEIEIKVDALRR